MSWSLAYLRETPSGQVKDTPRPPFSRGLVIRCFCGWEDGGGGCLFFEVVFHLCRIFLPFFVVS